MTNSTTRRLRALVAAAAIAVSVTVTTAPAVADTGDSTESTVEATQGKSAKGATVQTRGGITWL